MKVLKPLSSASTVLASAPSWTPTITTSGELLGLEGGPHGGLALDVPGKATPSRLEGPHGKGVDCHGVLQHLGDSSDLVPKQEL